MSPIERLSESIIGGLKNQPLILALLVFNLGIFVLIYFSLSGVRQKEERLMSIVLSQQSESMKMLANCAPAR